jgi:hypothetical protein
MAGEGASIAQRLQAFGAEIDGDEDSQEVGHGVSWTKLPFPSSYLDRRQHRRE